MSELDNAIKKLKANADNKEVPYIIADVIKKNCSKDVINLILQNLNESNSNPSKALKCLTGLEKEITRRDGYISSFLKIKFDTIKATLLKSQEQEKVFDDKLLFKDGSISCGFDYKGKQVVAMPLYEYSRLMEQEKVLKIIKEKNVDIGWFYQTLAMVKLGISDGCKYYNNNHAPNCVYDNNLKLIRNEELAKLTQEEFELLKRWFEND